VTAVTAVTGVTGLQVVVGTGPIRADLFIPRHPQARLFGRVVLDPGASARGTYG
jgi:hypothetical protein